MSQIFNNQNVHLQKNNLHNNSHNMVNTKDLCIYFRYISIYLYLFQIYINNNLTILIMVQARGVSAQLMVSVCTRKHYQNCAVNLYSPKQPFEKLI